MINKLKSFSFRKLLFNRRFTVPFSIFLSLVLWMVITVKLNPIATRTFTDMTVAVNVDNTIAEKNGMSIIGDVTEQRFSVLVMGQNHIVAALSSEDINIYASAATVDAPGEYELSVSATDVTASADYDIVSITPKTVKVTFDYIETREFTVNALADGATASEGLIAEIPVVSGIEGNTVTVVGPRTVINSIEGVTAKAKVNKTLSQSETFDASIVLTDGDGNEISTENLQISASQVKITVPISKKATVPVKVDFSNTPKDFDKSSINAAVDHSEITVIGTPETVDKIKEVLLSPIDITTLTAKNNKFEVSAKLPEGVRMFDSIENFVVTARLSGYSEKTITVSRAKYTGLSGSLNAGGFSPIKNVKIYGPSNVIRNLQEDTVYAEINLADKKVGEHEVNVVINFEGIKNVWALGTYKTSVTVK